MPGSGQSAQSPQKIKTCGEWGDVWAGCLQGLRECTPLGVGRGGRRPSAQHGELGECKWAWEAAGLEPWALQDPRFWDPARWVRSCLTPSKGVHLCWWLLGLQCTLRGLPQSTPGSCSVGLQLCVSSWWWRSHPSCFLQDTCDVLQLQPHQELPPL